MALGRALRYIFLKGKKDAAAIPSATTGNK